MSQLAPFWRVLFTVNPNVFVRALLSLDCHPGEVAMFRARFSSSMGGRAQLALQKDEGARATRTSTDEGRADLSIFSLIW